MGSSVHLTLFPTAEELDSGLSAAKRAQWEKLLAVRDAVLKALERARQAKAIRSSLEAKVFLRADGDLGRLLADYRDELAALFIVSYDQVEIGKDARARVEPTDLPSLEIAVEPADGKKCERCWNYSTSVGQHQAQPTLCERCVRALAQIGAH